MKMGSFKGLQFGFNFGLHVGRTHVGRTHVGQRHVGRTHVGRTQDGRTHVGRTHVGWTHVGLQIATQKSEPPTNYIPVKLIQMVTGRNHDVEAG